MSSYLYTPNSYTKISAPTFSASSMMSSTSPLVRLSFVAMVLLAFLVVLRIGVYAISRAFTKSSSPHLFDGMIDAKHMLVYPQDPDSPDAVTIYRSIDANEGIEFTWSSWIYINNLQYGEGLFKNIFYKGNRDTQPSGLNGTINSPGLYIAPNTNSLVLLMNTFNTINQEIIVPGVPLNKWLSVVIRCRNTTLDVYINGTIMRSVELDGLPRQNYGDVYVASNGGFDGYISNLWYHNYALGALAINDLVAAGPNTTLIGSGEGVNMVASDYLSLRWFFGPSYSGASPLAPVVPRIRLQN